MWDQWQHWGNGVNLREGSAKGAVVSDLIMSVDRGPKSCSPVPHDPLFLLNFKYLQCTLSMTNNGLGGLEAGKHEKSHMFWTSSWPRCICRQRGDKAACVCLCGATVSECMLARAVYTGKCALYNSVCGRNQFTKDNCTFPEGGEEEMKGNKRMSLHHCAQMALMRTMIVSKWIQLRSCYSQTWWISMYSCGDSLSPRDNEKLLTTSHPVPNELISCQTVWQLNGNRREASRNAHPGRCWLCGS